MINGNLNWITNFIWGIADDVLRDVYVRGKYRDVILPMVVIRRLDAVLEPTKQAVLAMAETLNRQGVARQHEALCKAAGQAFYNVSPFTLRDLRARSRAHQLEADFRAYIGGFSPNVRDILEKFKLHNQIPTLVENDILGSLIEKLLDPDINLSPEPVRDSDGSVRLPGLDNHAMGTIFEELIRRFNEANNEEAGEHFTPRDVVRLMADLVFLPIADKLASTTYLVYDGACGTGGMLTVADERLQEIAAAHDRNVAIHLYGQEINAETYAITKADLLLKGEGDEVEHFALGSTLSQDGFPSYRFDFMLSNPPYGKSWKTDLERMGGKSEMRDRRFIVNHAGDPEFNLITRSSDGQLMFLVNMLSKMKDDTPLGSRIAEVHNGSSLFTGDAGQGESNTRRWIIENDWLEAIIALPLNMFYNTGIATYIWVLTNRKAEHRTGKVQLIDATEWYTPLRKNLGQKNCEVAEADAQRIIDAFLAFEETDESQIFANEEFGYSKITVERPLRLQSAFSQKAVQGLRYASGDQELRRELYTEYGDLLYEDFSAVRPALEERLAPPSDDEDEDDDAPKKPTVSRISRKKLLDGNTWKRDRELMRVARQLRDEIGDEVFTDHNAFLTTVDDALAHLGLKLRAPEKRDLIGAVSWRDDDAPPVVKKVHKAPADPDPLHGLFEEIIDGERVVVEYEADSELRDTEQVPLLYEGGPEQFMRDEVLPYAADAWMGDTKTKRGYEVSFNRYFYEPPPLRSLSEIADDLVAVQDEAAGLLDTIIGQRGRQE